jgi:sugar phosphate isomerase/epimerase
MLSSAPHRRTFLAAGAGLSLLPHAQALQSSPASSLPKFQLGIVTYNIAAEWDLPTILKICRDVGLVAVELRTTHKHGVEPSIPREKRTEVRQRFADAGITLWGLGTVCEFHATEASVVQKNIETCKAFLQLAHDLDAKGVKVRPNGLPKNVPEEKTLEQIGKALIPCAQTAADLGREVWVEVHGNGTSHPPHMRTIMEVCNHPNVGVTWNSNREDVQHGSVKPYFELLRPWIKSCHINALYSSYPYRELFGCLSQAGYDRVTLVEIPEKLEPTSGALLLRYYRALWTELCHS